MPEGEGQLKLFPPKNPRKSGVWKLFGFVMNSEGLVEENGFPICRLCHQVVASKDGNTSNMHSHLQRHHQTVYAELKVRRRPTRSVPCSRVCYLVLDMLPLQLNTVIMMV